MPQGRADSCKARPCGIPEMSLQAEKDRGGKRQMLIGFFRQGFVR